MKKLLVGLLVIGSFSSFAVCNVFVDGYYELNANAEGTSEKVLKKVKRELDLNGYKNVSSEAEADIMFKVGGSTSRIDNACIGGLSYLIQYSTYVTNYKNEVLFEMYSGGCSLFGKGRTNNLLYKQAKIGIEALSSKDLECNRRR